MRPSARARWLAGLAVLLTLAATTLAACGDDADGEESGGGSNATLTVGSWGGVLDEAIQDAYLDPFEADGGAAGRTVAAPGVHVARIEAQNQAGEVEWDLVDPAGDAAFILNQKGYLAELPDDLRSTLEDEMGPERVTSFGFAHGNIANVIVCNMERMKTCPRNMEEFYDVERFPQRRTFAGIGPMLAATTAQVASGVSRDETAETPLDLDATFGQLERIKPKIEVFWQSGDQQEQVFRSGGADMGIIWSNRAYRLRESGMDVEINWTDGAYEPGYWAVLEGAPNEDEAFDLLEWIGTHPQAQAEWAEAVGSSVSHPEAFDALPKPLVEESADNPENFELLAIPNFEWYSENTKELDDRYRDFVRGG
jgi:putative spermidine/putrescine transport system substrate-binding protein